MSIYIFGCRIYLDSDPAVANASDIGLYDDADNGLNQVFRWIDADISGYAPTYTWKPGVLKPSPFEDIEESVDLSYGGNLPSVGGNSIKVTDTISYGGSFTQLDKILNDNNLRLHGLRCDIVRFEVSGGTLEDADGTIVFRGICGDIEWVEKVLTIPVENALLKRKANLATIVNATDYPDASPDIIGKSIPVTFGEFKPEFDTDGNPEWNGYAKFVRTANKEELVIVKNSFNYYDYIDGHSQILYHARFNDTAKYKEIKQFPIIGNDGNLPPIMYKVRMANGPSTWATWDGVRWNVHTNGTLSLDSIFADEYIQVIEGTGNGQYRKIESAQVDIDTDEDIIEFTLYDYFEDTLAGNATATAEDQSWIQIIDVARSYTSDVWPCKDYLDENGDVITQGLNLYSHSQESKAKVTTEDTDAIVEDTPIQFYRVPEYAYEDSGSGDKNKIDIDVKLFNGNPDQMDCFLIKPIENFELNTADTLEEWAHTAGQNWHLWTKDQDGLYIPASGTPPGAIQLNKTSAIVSYITDKNSSTFYYISAQKPVPDVYVTGKYFISFIFDVPTFPKRLSFDNIYLIIKFSSNTTIAILADVDLYVRYKRFMGFASNILSQTNAFSYWDRGNVQGTDKGELRSDPDFYFTDSPDTKNKYFYVDNTVSAPERKLWGYQKLKFDGITNEDLYNSIQKVGILVNRAWAPQENRFTSLYSIYELAVAFKKSVSIKDAIYSSFRGRIYGAQWGQQEGSSSSSLSSSSSSSSSESSPSFSSSSSSTSQSSSSSSQSSPSSSSSSSTSCVFGAGRKNGCAMINNPVDVYEHVMRLQNWSEQGETKDWGKEYANVPLIDVATTEGGFDYEDLDVLKDIKIARQILNEKDAETSSLAKSICKNFFGVGYQNPATGKESFAYITGKSLSTPATTITLSDIIGDIGVVKFPRMKGIFTEPFVRYAKNNATGEYEKTIRLTNTDAATFDASYVIGLSDTSAEFLWTKAHVLREAYRQVESPSSDMTDLDWIYDSSDAEWYIDNWLSWMGGISTDGTVSGVEFEPKKRISFTVPYYIGKDWFLTKHFNLQLPHQTNDTAVECLIEELSKNISQGSESVTVQVVLYGAASEVALYVQDTVDAGVLLADWQDNYDLEGVSGGGADIQDMT